MKTVPVDYDPFAPKLVPVEGDPFAASATGPAKDVSTFFNKQITPAQGISDSFNEATEPVQPDTSFLGGVAKGTQKVGKGLANVAGSPVDIMTLMLNGMSGLVNSTGNAAETIGGWAGNDFEIPDIPRVTNPIGGSDFIADKASQAFEAAGGHVYDDAEFTPRQHLVGNLVDFGTQAATGGAGLIKAGAMKAAQAGPSLGRMLADMVPNYITNPYKQAPGRMLVNDVAGGVGSGAALEATDEYLPEGIAQNPLVRFVASMLGGGAGATVSDVATRLPKQGVSAITERLPAAKEFQDPDASVPVTQKTVDQAVNFVHQNSTDPRSALAQLVDELNFYYQAGGSMPTTGLMTDDTGLQLMDRKARDQDPKPFIERDKGVRNSAFQDVENLRPEDGNPNLPREISEQEIAARQGGANARLASAEQEVARQNKGDLALGDQYAQPPMNQEQASIALDKALVQDTGIPMRGQKRDKYAAIDPAGTEMIDTENLVSLAKDLERAASAYPSSTRTRMVPEGLISDIKAFEPKIDPKTGENVGGPGEVSFKSLNDWRKPLSEMENEARRNGQFGIADSLMKIRKAISGETEALAESGSPAGERAKEANRFYQDDYKPFREGPVGDLMRDVARDPQRTRTPPSETASRVIVKGPGAPEAGANVNAALDRGAPPAAAAGREAIKNYFLADMRHVVRDGKVQETRLAAWIKNNESTLDAYPAFKKEVTDLLGNVRGRGAQGSKLDAELKAASENKAQTDRDLAKSGFAIFAGREPEKAVGALFSADDPVAAVKQLRTKFAGNKEADAGLKAAVADHLIEQLTTSGRAGVTGDASPLSLAKIEATFRRNEKLLTEVFGSDMRYLQQARRRLEALSKRANQATPGSATVERGGVDAFAQGLLKPAEIIAKLMFGQLEGGGYTRSARLLAQQMPDSTRAARDLVHRMFFDPELAKHILSATPKEVAGPGWSKRLNRMMGWAEAGRASGRGDGDGDEREDRAAN